MILAYYAIITIINTNASVGDKSRGTAHISTVVPEFVLTVGFKTEVMVA